MEQYVVVAALEENVLITDAGNTAGSLVRNNLADSASQSTDNGMVFNGNDFSGLFGGLCDGFFVNGLNRRHMQNACADSLLFQQQRRLQSGSCHHTGGDDGNILAVFHGNCFAERNLVVLSKNCWNLTTHGAQVYRAVHLDRHAGKQRSLPRVCRVKDRHIGKCAHDRYIFHA